MRKKPVRRLWEDVPSNERTKKEYWGYGCAMAVPAVWPEKATKWRQCSGVVADGETLCFAHGGPLKPKPPPRTQLDRLRSKHSRLLHDIEALEKEIVTLSTEEDAAHD